MALNIKRLKKNEIEWLWDNRCKKHSHRYLEHYSCFLHENPQNSPLYEKVGFLDIESTGLQADFCFILSYKIKEMNGKILGRVLTPNEIRNGTFDKKLLKECVEDMRKFDRIVVFYGSDYKFDIPTLRTRTLRYNLDFPLYKEIKVTDLHPIIKKKFNLHNNRLMTACSFFGIESKGHMMNPDMWMGAISGNKKALDWVKIHNEEDVISTEKLYLKVIDFVSKSNTSI